ncbi:hypothetical protein [Leucobacter sp. GX24907]
MAQRFTFAAAREQLVLAGRGLRAWRARQYLVAGAAAVGFGLLVGVVTVLIPNSWFARDIDTVWWNYPVWILTSIGAGMLTATYIRLAGSDSRVEGNVEETPAERRTARMGIVGGLLTWFAVGCPVCNKIALLALGYSGAITWFAPFQPVLAVAAMILTGLALIWRLKGQVACPVTPAPSPTSSQQMEPAA